MSTVKTFNPNTERTVGDPDKRFSYQPNVSSVTLSVTPTFGALAGGTAITINATGSPFLASPTVTVGGVSCTSVVRVNANQITCTTGAHAVGTVNVVVTNTDSSTYTITSGYFYGVAVTSVTPATGIDQGGTSVTVAGNGFSSGAGVTFGGNSATSVSVVNQNSITCTTPAHAGGTFNVVVTNTNTDAGTLTNGFTYTNSPTLGSVTPSIGRTAGGTNVTLSGANFASGCTVTFGGVSATNVVFVNSTTVTCTTPSGSGAVNVIITNSDTGTSTLTSGFTYGNPTISSIVNSSGPTSGGTSVTINGTNYFTGASVTFGGTPGTSVVVVNSGQITVTSPAHSAGAVDVQVVNADGGTATSAGGFTYTSGSISVTSVSPTSGPISGGTTVTINGTNFVSTPTVTFGGTSATNVTFVNSGQITVTSPAKSVGLYDVVVTNPDTTNATLTSAYTYTLKDQLVAYYQLVETSGARPDSHTNVYDLTDNNSVLFEAGFRTTLSSAIANPGGATDRLVATSTSFLQAGNIDFSWAGWVSVTSPAQRCILSKNSGASSTGQWEYRIDCTAANKIQFQVSANAAGTNTALTSTASFNNYQWAFICARYTSSSRQMALSINNGSTDTATAATLLTTNVGPLLFGGLLGFSGAGGPSFAAGFAGRISNWGYWKKVLSASEITFLYNSGYGKYYSDLTGSLTASIMAYWNFTEKGLAANGGYVDSVNGNTLVTTQAMGVANTTIGISAGAGFFTNAHNYLSRAGGSFAPIDNTTGDFSVSFWENQGTNSGNRTCVYKGGNVAAAIGFHISKSNQSYTIGIADGITLSTLSTGGSFAAGTWYNVTAVYNRASNMVLYVNGSSFISKNIIGQTVPMGTNDFNIGGINTTNSNNSVIQYVGVWSKALSTTEISAIYNSGTPLGYTAL